MKNKSIIKYLRELLSYLEYHNSMAPFPVYDTEYVGKVREVLDNMKKSEIDYDKLPVAACKYCNSLHIEVDEVDNDVCMRCGSINEIVIYKDIEEYGISNSEQGQEEA